MTASTKPRRPAYVTCPECGGYGGIDAASFGDQGWHPCYHCGTTGVVARAEQLDRRRQELEYCRATRAWRKEHAVQEAKVREQNLGRWAWDALLGVGRFDDSIPF